MEDANHGQVMRKEWRLKDRELESLNWKQDEEWEEGYSQSNFQTNLFILLIELSPLFWHFINATQLTTWTDTSVHLIHLKSSMIGARWFSVSNPSLKFCQIYLRLAMVIMSKKLHNNIDQKARSVSEAVDASIKFLLFLLSLFPIPSEMEILRLQEDGGRTYGKNK